ncbi:MAG: DciA family protein [Bauldia sp.]
MAESQQPNRRRGAISIAELVGKVIDPVTKRRGFATTDLIAAWPQIVGPRYADCSRPEKILWPKGEDMEGAPALLVLRVDGPRAIFVQHEAGQIIERVNAFLGYGAIGHLRIIQAPVSSGVPPAAVVPKAVDPAEAARVEAAVSGVGSDRLREALGRLGRGVLRDKAR